MTHERIQVKNPRIENGHAVADILIRQDPTHQYVELPEWATFGMSGYGDVDEHGNVTNFTLLGVSVVRGEK